MSTVLYQGCDLNFIVLIKIASFVIDFGKMMFRSQHLIDKYTEG